MEINIITLLQKYSGEIILAAAAANILSLVLSKLFKASAKSYTVYSFLFGATIYAAVGAFIVREDTVTLFANTLSCGLLSAALCIVIKRFAFLNGNDIKKSIEKLLSSIVLSEQLDEVVEGIIEKLKNSTTVTKENIIDLVKDNLTSSCSDEELDRVCGIIFTALKGAEGIKEVIEKNDDSENQK